MNRPAVVGWTLGILALLLPIFGCSSSSSGSPPPWEDLEGVWDVTFDEIVDNCWGVTDKNLLWKLERSGLNLLKKEYNKDTQLCGPTDLLEGDAFEDTGDVSLQLTLPMDRNGCAETYTVTVTGSWSVAGFDFNVVEQWTANNPGDPDCVENYPCDREYDLTATPSADPFPAPCDV
jgi:hypothetical protein